MQNDSNTHIFNTFDNEDQNAHDAQKAHSSRDTHGAQAAHHDKDAHELANSDEKRPFNAQNEDLPTDEHSSKSTDKKSDKREDAAGSDEINELNVFDNSDDVDDSSDQQTSRTLLRPGMGRLFAALVDSADSGIGPDLPLSSLSSLSSLSNTHMNTEASTASASHAASESESGSHLSSAPSTDTNLASQSNSKSHARTLNQERSEGSGGSGIPDRLNVSDLIDSLCSTQDPINVLRLLMHELTSRKTLAEKTEVSAENTADPASKTSAMNSLIPLSNFEAFLLKRLEETQLMEQQIYPAFDMIRPISTQLVFVRFFSMEENSRAHQRGRDVLLHVEVVLNTCLLIEEALSNPHAMSLAALTQTERYLFRSIASQLNDIVSDHHDTLAARSSSEFGARWILSYGIEHARIPFRLQADYRLNTELGKMTLWIHGITTHTLPQSNWVSTLGYVPTTPQLKQRMADDINLRMLMCVVRYAFLQIPGLQSIDCKLSVSDQEGYRCLCIAHITRANAQMLSPAPDSDPVATFRDIGASLHFEHGALQPIQDTMPLENLKVCPKDRFLPPEVQDVDLSRTQKQLLLDLRDTLGYPVQLSDFGIHAASWKTHIAEELSRGWDGSAHMLITRLNELRKQPDLPAELSYATYTAIHDILEGTINNSFDFVEAFTNYTPCDTVLTEAAEMIEQGDYEHCLELCRSALHELESSGTYTTNDKELWLSFAELSDRAIFNALELNKYANPMQRICLLPDAYAMAYLYCAISLIFLQRIEEACFYIDRFLSFAPYSTPSLHIVHALVAGRYFSEAKPYILKILETAHDSTTIGLLYLNLVICELQLNQDIDLIQALIKRSTYFTPQLQISTLPITNVSLVQSIAPEAIAHISLEKADAILRKHHIPVAPSNEVWSALKDMTEAMISAEVFSVGRPLLETLAHLSKSDVLYHMLHSMEAEVDS